MAKEFKEFDKKYSKHKGKFLEYESSVEDLIKESAIDIAEVGECWRKESDTYLGNKEKIRDAVYESESAEEWQKFRVSLKGFDTAHKLARLQYREHVMANYYTDGFIDKEEYEREEVRMDNYIGALRRGGQLDSEYRIVK